MIEHATSWEHTAKWVNVTLFDMLVYQVFRALRYILIKEL